MPEEATTIETERHHRRRHKHKHGHHHHHQHSGATPDEEFPIFDGPQPMIERGYPINTDSRSYDQRVDQRQYHTHNAASPTSGGNFADALRKVLEAVNSLPGRSHRQRLLGHAIARLIEQDRISGLGDVASVVHNEINRYAFISDDIERQTKVWQPSK